MIDRYIVIDVVSGRTEAEFLRSYLRARGVHCELSQEALGHVYGLETGALGQVELLVPSRQGKKAREALQEYKRTKRKTSPRLTSQAPLKKRLTPLFLLWSAGVIVLLLSGLFSFYTALTHLELAGGRSGLIVTGLLFMIFAVILARTIGLLRK